jgi:hypothetical protein
MVLLLSSSFPFGIDVGVQGVWFTSGIPHELEVNLSWYCHDPSVTIYFRIDR